MSRVWAMPNKETFKIEPIKHLLDFYVKDGKGWADPFAGNNSPAEFTNDLNPKTKAKDHLLAIDWIKNMNRYQTKFEGVLFDPPYSGRQVKECYNEIGKMVHMDDTNSYFYTSVKHAISSLVKPNGTAICFGWNSTGFGKGLNFELEEILLVAHGGNHNDTIVTVERKINQML